MTALCQQFPSWGRYPIAAHQVFVPGWRQEILKHLQNIPAPETALPYGNGRSYGDVCLNDGNRLIVLRHLNHFMSFDPVTGVLQAEAGVRFDQILALILPHGWFLPVTPGTQFVTLGGAIANDVHGKNHHREGTFGCHVQGFHLLRSDGSHLWCTPEENVPLFKATIGGLGLTGIITDATVQLKKVPGPAIDQESIKFDNLEEFFALSKASDQDFDYTVAWIDCLALGKSLGRGHFLRGNHTEQPVAAKKCKRLTFPVEIPFSLVNQWSLKAFNLLYYHRQQVKMRQKVVPYPRFFYPLDSIHHWNRLYGRKGFLQHQCVVPLPDAPKVTAELLKAIAAAHTGSFLAVLKTFGSAKSPGLLSFPRPGATLALDFPFQGEKTLRLFKRLNDIVYEAGGAVYPAKDATMEPHHFGRFYPAWGQVEALRDPAISSSFWLRVTHGH